MKRSVFSIIGICLALLVCSAAVFAAGSQESASAGKEVVLTYLAASNWIKDYEYIMAEEFSAETGIRIDFQELPPDQYENVVKLKLSAREGVDIFGSISGVPALQKFQPEKNMIDLSGEPWVEKLKGWATVGASYDGRLVGLNLWSVSNNAIMYNSSIFSDLGLQVPKDYDSFTAVCDALLAAGITPIYEFAKDLWHTQYWMETMTYQETLRDPDFIEKLNTNKLKYADVGSFLTALTQLRDMEKKGYFGEYILSNTFDESWEAMASGKYGMIMIWDSFGTEIESKFGVPQDVFKMFPNPMAGNTVRSTTAGGILKVPYAGSDHLDEVLQYFRFITSPERVQAYYDNSSDLNVPSMAGITYSPTAAVESLNEITREEGIGIEGLCLYYDPMSLGKYIQSMFLGAMTPEQILAAMDADRAITARAAGDPNW